MIGSNKAREFIAGSEERARRGNAAMQGGRARSATEPA